MKPRTFQMFLLTNLNDQHFEEKTHSSPVSAQAQGMPVQERAFVFRTLKKGTGPRKALFSARPDVSCPKHTSHRPIFPAPKPGTSACSIICANTAMSTDLLGTQNSTSFIASNTHFKYLPHIYIAAFQYLHWIYGKKGTISTYTSLEFLISCFKWLKVLCYCELYFFFFLISNLSL